MKSLRNSISRAMVLGVTSSFAASSSVLGYFPDRISASIISSRLPLTFYSAFFLFIAKTSLLLLI